VDIDLEHRDIGHIKLTIEDFKEEVGRMLWNIKVEETPLTSLNKPNKSTAYNIKRTFTDFKWLLQVYNR
jgi:hypothetical protein